MVSTYTITNPKYTAKSSKTTVEHLKSQLYIRFVHERSTSTSNYITSGNTWQTDKSLFILSRQKISQLTFWRSLSTKPSYKNIDSLSWDGKSKLERECEINENLRESKRLFFNRVIESKRFYFNPKRPQKILFQSYDLPTSPFKTYTHQYIQNNTIAIQTNPASENKVMRIAHKTQS